MQLSLRGAWVAMGVLALTFAATPARADVILLDGNVPQIDENVLLAAAGTGDPIFGLTNQTGLAVEFNSNETVTSPSSGQARIEALDQTLSQLAISVVGGSFTSLIFNLNALTTGTVNFTAMDTQGDAFNFSRTVTGGGQNFFTFVAINGQQIDLLSLATVAPLTIADIRQVRIGGAAADNFVVPEPSALLLTGMGLAAVSFRRRKYQRR